MKIKSVFIWMAFSLFVAMIPAKALTCEWRRYNGKLYWYEDGVRQGVHGDPKNIIDKIYGVERGREIYDPKSDAWYWLDADANGAKAEGKDVWLPYVYQDEKPGSTEGKWVRYDSQGRMVKGVQLYEKNNSWYQFDKITGAMFKGWHKTSSGNDVYYDKITGKLKESDFTLNRFRYGVDPDTAHITSCLPEGKIKVNSANSNNQLDCAIALVQQYLSNAHLELAAAKTWNKDDDVKESLQALALEFGYEYKEFMSVAEVVSALRRGMFIVINGDMGKFAQEDYYCTTYVLVGFHDESTTAYNMEDGSLKKVKVKNIFTSGYFGLTGSLGIIAKDWKEIEGAALGIK